MVSSIELVDSLNKHLNKTCFKVCYTGIKVTRYANMSELTRLIVFFCHVLSKPLNKSNFIVPDQASNYRILFLGSIVDLFSSTHLSNFEQTRFCLLCLLTIIEEYTLLVCPFCLTYFKVGIFIHIELCVWHNKVMCLVFYL